jgi:hypothetical protein
VRLWSQVTRNNGRRSPGAERWIGREDADVAANEIVDAGHCFRISFRNHHLKFAEGGSTRDAAATGISDRPRCHLAKTKAANTQSRQSRRRFRGFLSVLLRLIGFAAALGSHGGNLDRPRHYG